jgi:hypothetical protein
VLNKKTLIAHIAILTILMTALAIAGPAADKTKGKILLTVAETFFAAGNEVKSGEYEVKWESSGTDATTTFVAREKIAATIQGKIVQLEKKSEYDTLLTTKDSSGRTAVKELLLSGKPFKIVF